MVASMENDDKAPPTGGRRRLAPWIAAGGLIVAITVIVGVEFGAAQAWGLGGLLVGLTGAAAAVVAHVSAPSPTPTQKPDPASLARDLRRPYYKEPLKHYAS